MISLSNLLSELANAGSLASRKASDYTRQRLMDAFTKNSDDVLVPNSDKFDLGTGEPVEIPEYILVRAGGLDLDQLTVKFETEMDFSHLDDDSADDTGIKIKPKTGLIRRNSHVQVEAVFKMGPRPEAAEVVTDTMVAGLRDEII